MSYFQFRRSSLEPDGLRSDGCHSCALVFISYKSRGRLHNPRPTSQIISTPEPKKPHSGITQGNLGTCGVIGESRTRQSSLIHVMHIRNAPHAPHLLKSASCIRGICSMFKPAIAIYPESGKSEGNSQVDIYNLSPPRVRSQVPESARETEIAQEFHTLFTQIPVAQGVRTCKRIRAYVMGDLEVPTPGESRAPVIPIAKYLENSNLSTCHLKRRDKIPHSDSQGHVSHRLFPSRTRQRVSNMCGRDRSHRTFGTRDVEVLRMLYFFGRS